MTFLIFLPNAKSKYIYIGTCFTNSINAVVNRNKIALIVKIISKYICNRREKLRIYIHKTQRIDIRSIREKRNKKIFFTDGV